MDMFEEKTRLRSYVASSCVDSEANRNDFHKVG
jgi:hypothetical protein